MSVTDLPSPRVAAEVLLAITEEGLSTAVPRGENAGVTEVHAPVARSMEKVGAIAAEQSIPSTRSQKLDQYSLTTR